MIVNIIVEVFMIQSKIWLIQVVFLTSTFYTKKLKVYDLVPYDARFSR